MKCDNCAVKSGQKLWKVTCADCMTRGNTLWGPNVEHTAPGGHLCSDEVIHAYADPYLAAIMAPMHVSFGQNAMLWEANGDISCDDGTRVGCTRLRTILPISCPQISREQRAQIAIGFVGQIIPRSAGDWLTWAANWMQAKDRTIRSAEVIAEKYSKLSNMPAALAALTASFAAKNMEGFAAWCAAQTIWETIDIANINKTNIPNIISFIRFYLKA